MGLLGVVSHTNPCLSTILSSRFFVIVAFICWYGFSFIDSDNLQMCGTKAGLRWVRSCQRSAVFSLGYVFYRLQQHLIPGTSLAYRLVSRSRILGEVIIPVPLGE